MSKLQSHAGFASSQSLRKTWALSGSATQHGTPEFARTTFCVESNGRNSPEVYQL